jgi:hypothetical protein
MTYDTPLVRKGDLKAETHLREIRITFQPFKPKQTLNRALEPPTSSLAA